MATKVIVVPGLAVRTYAVEPVERLRRAGYDADLRPGLAWRGVPVDLADYGRELAADIEAAGTPVDVLVGLSAGSQAAALAASITPLVRRVVLVSPTIEPSRRNTAQMLGIYFLPNPDEQFALFSELLPDWSRAGPGRILRGFRSMVRLPLEDVLPRVTAELTIVHGDHDQLTTYSYAATLAAEFGGTLRVAPDGAHSWPTRDPEGFLRLVEDLLGVRRPNRRDAPSEPASQRR